MRRVLLRVVAPATAAATVGGSIAATDGPSKEAALQLRNTALRAQSVLSEPPRMLARVARSNWRGHAAPEAVDELSRKQATLRGALQLAARSWSEHASLEPHMLDDLHRATEAAEAAVASARASAVRGAAAIPWGDVVGDVRLERADCTTGDETVASQSLRGRIVGLYFTASWCGPCRRFTPKLVDFYKQASERGLEVVLVSWDESSASRCHYAASTGMPWLSLPQDDVTLADELSLRYDVRTIPSLVVLEVSEDGREARILSREGRMDVETGRTAWLTDRTPSDSSHPSRL